jgi:hypothetical protein
VAHGDVSAYEDAADQRLLQLLLGHLPDGDGAGQTPYVQRRSQQQMHGVVAPILYDLLLPELCATGRFIWRRDTTAELDDTQSLAWDAEAPWQFKLCVEPDEVRRHWCLRGQLVRNAHAVPLRDAVLLLADGLVVFPRQVSRLAASRDFGWIATLRQAGELRIPYRDREPFLELWWSAPDLPMATLPPELDLPTELGVPTGTLSVLAPQRDPEPHLYARVTVHYGGHAVDPEIFQAGIVDLHTPRVIRRDPEAEAALVAQLTDLGVRLHRGGPTDAGYRLARRQLPAVTDALLQRGWVVEADGVRMHAPGQMTFRMTSGVDWFELHLEWMRQSTMDLISLHTHVLTCPQHNVIVVS